MKSRTWLCLATMAECSACTAGFGEGCHISDKDRETQGQREKTARKQRRNGSVLQRSADIDASTTYELSIFYEGEDGGCGVGYKYG